jgi:predicted RNA-binding Zn-ribbon protein involved in translation (DUF1610 family)
MALAHRCTDGSAQKLRRIEVRTGVLFECPKCGRVKTADEIERDFEALRPKIVAALSR